MLSLEDQVRALGPYSWVEGDYYAEDSVSHRLLALLEKVSPGSGIRVSTPGHMFSQTNSAYQPPLPTPVGVWNGALGIAFKAADGGRGLKSTAGKPAWRPAHDGTGWTSIILGVCASNAIMVAHSDVSTPLTGMHIYVNALQPTALVYPGAFNANTMPPGSINVSRRFVLRHGSGSSPQWRFQDLGYGDTNGAYTGAPGLGDAELPMWLAGQDTGAGVPGYTWDGPFAAALFFTRVISDAELQTVLDYLAAKYRAPTIQDVLPLAQSRPFFDAAFYAVDTISGKVNAFIDANDPTHLLLQSDSTKQVAVPAPHADFGGALCATFTGAESYVSNRPATQWVTEHDGVSSEVFLVFNPTAADVWFLGATASNAGVAGAHYYCDGNLRHHLSTSAGGAVINAADGGPIAVGVPTYLVVRHQASGSPQYAVSRKGAVITSGAYAIPADPGPAAQPFELGGRAAALYAPMRWTTAGFFPALDPTQRATVQGWIQTARGVAA